MRVSTAISRIKAAGHDISDEYTTERCIEFLNSALQQTAALLISAQYPALLKQTNIHHGEGLPKNYIKPAGTYPLRLTNGVVEITDDDLEFVKFRYWATPNLIDNAVDELPYPHDAINEVVVKAAIIMALNENEYDVSQDGNILSALQAAVAGAMA